MRVFNCEVTKGADGKILATVPDLHGITVTGTVYSVEGRQVCIAKPGDDESTIRRRLHDVFPKDWEALEDTQGRGACHAIAAQVHAMLANND